MTPYIVMLLAPAIPFLLRIKRHGKVDSKRDSINLFFAIYLLLLVMRSSAIGRDLTGYESIFLSLSKEPLELLFQSDLEIGYVLLNKLISLFTSDFQWVIAVTAIITVIPIWYVYKKESEDAYITISLFVMLPTFAMSFSGLRQAIAVSFGALAYEFTKNKKPLRFVIAVAIAFLFHKSALILLLMYPLYWARMTKKWLVAIVPAMVAIFALNRPIFAFLQKLISDFYTTAATETNAYTMIVLFVLLAVFAFVIPDDKECDFDLIGFRNLLLFAIVIQMFVPLHTLAMRFNYYYIIFIPLLISKVVKYRSKRYNQVALLAKYVMIVFFVCYFFINTSSRNPLDIYPYKFFFSDI